MSINTYVSINTNVSITNMPIDANHSVDTNMTISASVAMSGLLREITRSFGPQPTALRGEGRAYGGGLAFSYE